MTIVTHFPTSIFKSDVVHLSIFWDLISYPKFSFMCYASMVTVTWRRRSKYIFDSTAKPVLIRILFCLLELLHFGIEYGVLKVYPPKLNELKFPRGLVLRNIELAESSLRL